MNYQDNFINLTPSRTDAFRDKLYLVICILFSCKVGCGALDIFGGYLGVDLISVLILIGAWLVFASANKNQNPLQGSGLPILYGSFKAAYIIQWITVGLMILVAFISLIMLGLVGYISDEASEQISDILHNSEIPFIADWFMKVSLTVIMGILILALLIGAVILAIINHFYYRKLYKATNDVRHSLSSVAPITSMHTLRIWFIIKAALNATELISFNVFNIASAGCMIAVYILLFIWTGKYFDDRSSNYKYSGYSENPNNGTEYQRTYI